MQNSVPVTDSLGRNQETTIINESGLYNVILRSDKPEAKTFKRWITHEILPQIRKTGGYVNNDELFIQTYLPFADDTTKQLFAATLSTVRAQNEQIEQQKKRIAELKPKADFTDKLLKSKDSLLVREFAKVMFDEKVCTFGEKQMYKWLRDNKYLMSHNEPYQQHMKHFEVVVRPIDTPFGVKETTTTKINPQGQLYFYNKLKTEK